MPINALDRSALQRSLKKLEEHIGGGKHVAVRAAGSALARGIRKAVSKTGGKDDFSRPGDAPLRKEGAGRKRKFRSVYKSIGTQVVEGTMRVGSGSFVARILEQGAITTPSRKDVRPSGQRRSAGEVGKRRSYPKGRIQKPRPFMAKGLAAAKSKMTEAVVDSLKKRGAMGAVVDLQGTQLPGGGQWRIDSGT